ncbi:hypothetical protein LOK49_LG04G01454 [Camellia lanceoleosa]|uniref:Uncharacterized protein n=1 Tax=Camellia lanceoleosa TaxID=1840588 RepID=A0ACC0HUF0_9ERIC|nr:hypothetical protein LOK49_LG04G01454 [Camellia lanceoleosa]
MVVGMVGNEGIVVGMVGSEAAGNGGRVTLGSVGMVVGKVDGIWVLGKGGNVGFGKVGAAGIVGNGGNVAWGMVGIVGNGGSVTFGRDGIEGTVACSSWRAARAATVVCMLESDNAMIRDTTKQL